MGNPLLDILAPTDSTILEKFNLQPNDAILAEKKHMPLYQELIENYKVDYIAAGSTLNSVRIAQVTHLFMISYFVFLFVLINCDISVDFTKAECMCLHRQCWQR